ncbi:MAG: Wzz/FepE/Etk N-terminal domain-containing protein, partial [Acidobacteriota bacterium]
MKKSRLQGFKDYMAVIIRRKWWILAAFIIFAGFAGLFAAIVPDIYISDATILIQPKDISSDLVPELIDSNTEQRLSIIEARILSRNNLQQILEEFKNEL